MCPNMYPQNHFCNWEWFPLKRNARHLDGMLIDAKCINKHYIYLPDYFQNGNHS